MNHSEIVSFLWGVADLIRDTFKRGKYQLNDNPGEHFTPRDVVHLMVDPMLAGDQARIRSKGVVRTVYDPCCGSGGMLMITKVQLVDATPFWVPMRKSLGDKRREIPLDRAQDILEILADFKDGDTRTVAKEGKEEEIVVRARRNRCHVLPACAAVVAAGRRQ